MPRQLTDDQLDSEMLFTIRMHRGQDNAIRRWDLCLKLFGEDAVLNRNDGNTHDRAVRKSIERRAAVGTSSAIWAAAMAISWPRRKKTTRTFARCMARTPSPSWKPSARWTRPLSRSGRIPCSRV